jgi:predicted NAD/FAD-binding protein
MSGPRQKIAVIGSGVAGIVSAYLLQRKYDVTLFEKNNYAGGHTNTVVIEEGPDAGTPVDTGFIVLNDRTYPLFTEFLSQLSVPVRDSDMSFGFYDERKGLQYSGNGIGGLFAQPSNALKPSFLRMIWDIRRFGREGAADLEKGGVAPVLGRYLESKRFSKAMIEDYLLPMGSAIWSTPPGEIWDFPAETFLKFFQNHGLLDLSDRPQWQTVAGGSQSYVRAFLKSFQGRVQLNAELKNVIRGEGEVVIQTRDSRFSFDHAVIASHADEALRMLDNPTPEEKRLLGCWSYQKNHTVLHTDISVLPPNRRAWASWNYTREKETGPAGKTSLTYHMNRLQGWEARNQYCVTLNRSESIPLKSVLREFHYTHPSYTLASVKSQAELPSLNGPGNIYFCGSYFGYGFHEDAVKSAVAVGQKLGVEL